MASTESTILAAVKVVIDALSPTVGDEECQIRKWPFDKGRDANHWYPGISLSRVKEKEFAGTNLTDDIGFGIQVTFVVDNHGDPTEDDVFAEWRQLIRTAFIHQRVNVVGVQTCLIEPGPVYQDTPENYDVSSFIIRVIYREPNRT